MNKKTNESPLVFYRTSSPLGPLPCSLSFQFKFKQSRATGIADHILPLGDLFSNMFNVFVLMSMIKDSHESVLVALLFDYLSHVVILFSLAFFSL